MRMGRIDSIDEKKWDREDVAFIGERESIDMELKGGTSARGTGRNGLRRQCGNNCTTQQTQGRFTFGLQ